MNLLVKVIPSYEINDEELWLFFKMVNSGISFKEAINLFKKENKAFAKLEEKLMKGYRIEDCFLPYLKKDTASKMSSFLHTLPFSKAIEMTFLLKKESKKQQKEIINDVLYPLGLLFFAMMILYFFDIYGFDIVMQIGGESSSLSYIRLIFRLIFNSLMLIILLALIILLPFLNAKRRIYAFIRFSHYFKNTFLHRILTLEFVERIILSERLGYGTKDSLMMIRQNKQYPFLSFIAYHVSENLKDGQRVDEAFAIDYLDKGLLPYLSLGLHSGCFKEMLERYCLIEKERNIKRRKKIFKGLKLIIYSIIAILLILLYQLLFYPLQALTII